MKLRIRPRWLFVILIALWTGTVARTGASAPPGEIILRETVLGPMPSDHRQLSISPDGKRVGLVGNAGSRQVVFIDGNEGAPYSKILPMPGFGPGMSGMPYVMLSADETQAAYIAKKGGSECVMVVNQKEGPGFDNIESATFAPAGHRMAYIADRGTQKFVVVDASVGPGYSYVSQLQFSADGEHVGYLARASGGASSWIAVVDGQTGPGYGSISTLQFSPSGGHYICVTGVSGATDVRVVVDGKSGPAFPAVHSVKFAKDGKHVAYVAGIKNPPGVSGPAKWVAVIDGQSGPEFLQVSDIVFSPDGMHTAYAGLAITGTGSSWYAIVDGKKSRDYDACSDFLFSSDSRHAAYVASNSQKSVVVLDGNESDAYRTIDGHSMHFSPDGTRLGFVAREENGFHAVVDGKMGPAHEVIDEKSFEFNPDGRHYRFKARAGSAWTVVVDDVRPDAASAPAELLTSEDGRHTAAIVTQNPGQSAETSQVLLDGKPVGPAHPRVEFLQLSPDGRRVAFACPKGDEPAKSQVVIDGQGGPGFMRITTIVFSPDSRHVAYVGWETSVKQYVVVDGFQGPAFDEILDDGINSPRAVEFRPDGSLDILAIKDGKLNRLVFGADALAALPKLAPTKGLASAGFSEIYTFGQTDHDGVNPALLVAASDGTLYGATSAGGEYLRGVLFKVKPDGSDYTILHQFLGNQDDGTAPSSLLIGPDRAIYGSLASGATYGMIFRVAADGSGYKIIHKFSGDGDGGHAVLVSTDLDGTLYGMSRNTSHAPTYLFRLKPDGSDFSVFYQPKRREPQAEEQDQQTGDRKLRAEERRQRAQERRQKAEERRQQPEGQIGVCVDGGDGYLYGVSKKTIFKIKKDGSGYSVLHTFEGRPLDAASAEEAPILGSDRVLYGMASNGGKSAGVIYKLNRDGSDYTVIANPDQPLQPRALAQGADGKLYALVREGLVRFNPNGSDWTVLKEMNGGIFSPSMVMEKEALYGMTPSGGNGRGDVFRYGLPGGSSAPAAPTAVVHTVPPTPLASN